MALSFAERARALEEVFFRRVDQELLAKLREQYAMAEAKEALRVASGLEDEDLLADLVRVGVKPDTFIALQLAPLVAVAWADGKVDQEERFQVLQAVKDAGIAEDHPALELLDGWLRERPSKQLLETWKDYVSALQEKLSNNGNKLLQADILKHAKAVAKASGGNFGFGAISPSEQRLLDEIQRALADQD